MHDTEADWYLQGVKHFSFHMTVVGNLDSTEPPGFCKQIFSEQESCSFLPPPTFML